MKEIFTLGHIIFNIFMLRNKCMFPSKVLKFPDIGGRMNFIEKLTTFLGKVGVGHERMEKKEQHILDEANTKAKRQKLLERFFRVVFAQVRYVNIHNYISRICLTRIFTNLIGLKCEIHVIVTYIIFV